MSPTLAASPAAPAGNSRSLNSKPQPKGPLLSSPKHHNDHEIRVVADRCLDITGSFLCVTVGKDGNRENFFLHERLFTSHSEFLRCAAKAEWLQQKNVIVLPEDDPTTFRLYAVLTYTGLLTTKDVPFEWQSLVDVYILAEKLQDSWAKNHVIDAMHSYVAEHLPRNHAASNGNNRFKNHISTESLCQIYGSTPTGSQARKLVVDLVADNASGDWLDSAGDLLPHEFLLEVTVCLLRKRPFVVFGNMLDRPSSHYHEKTEEQKGHLNTKPITETAEATGKSSPATIKPAHPTSIVSSVSITPLFGPFKMKEPTLEDSCHRTPSVVVTLA